MNTLGNPLLAESALPLGMPAFDQIENAHYGPAFEVGMVEHLAEIGTIANRTNEPTFENVFVALERSGRVLTRVSALFSNMVSAHTNDELEARRAQ
jgi:peptidyl-dipeptidase Dcp